MKPNRRVSRWRTSDDLVAVLLLAMLIGNAAVLGRFLAALIWTLP